MAKRGLTEYRLAQVSRVNQPTIHRILSGESADPKSATVKKLADYFGITSEELRGSDQSFKIKTGKFRALSEDAMELLAAFERLPPDRQQAYKDFLFLEVFALDQMPWLRRGRPVRESYDDYERRMIALGHSANETQTKAAKK